MKVIRYFCRSANALNILLLASLILLILYVLLPLFSMRVNYRLPSLKAKAIDEGKTFVAGAPMPPAVDFAIIGENNLFHPERIVPPEKKDEKALPRPELVLYGTVIDNGMSIAYIEDKKSPRTTPGRGKRQSVIKKGDRLGGFAVTEIESDRIVLTRGEERMVVPLLEAGKQRGNEPAKTAAMPAPSGALPSPGTLPSLLPQAASASPSPAVPPAIPPALTPATRSAAMAPPAGGGQQQTGIGLAGRPGQRPGTRSAYPRTQ